MYRQRSNEWIRHLDFEIMDLLCIEISYLLIWYFRNGRNLQILFSKDSTDIILILFMVNCISVFIMHPYKEIVQRGYWREFVSIFKHFTMVYFLVIIVYYLNHVSTSLPRLTVIGSWAFAMFFAYIFHIMNKLVIRKRLKLTRFAEQLLLVTDYSQAENTIHQLKTKIFSRFQICAVVLVDNNLSQSQLEEIQKVIEQCKLEHAEIIIGIGAGREFLRQQVVDVVFLDTVLESSQRENLIMEWLQMGLAVEIGLKQDYLHLPNSQLDHIGKRMVVRTTLNTAMSWQLALKRVMDIAGALVGLILTAIAGTFIVPAIKIADPGPVIFSQKRVGTNGRVFNFYKFRSMYMDAEARKAELMSQNQMQGLMFKMENDPRIIGSEKGPGKGLGNFLRKTSLDELPQFWNILKGDMSLVGTRPPTLGEYEQYEPRHKVRLSMKPGLTGMWQVSGRSDITDFEEVVDLDTQYIENWNLGMDIKILLKTVMVVLHKDGSR